MKTKNILLLFWFITIIINAQGQLKLLTSIHGEKEGDSFSTVYPVGDINGDGYNDFFVGSTKNYVKLYWGGKPFDTLNCVKFVGPGRKRVSINNIGVGDLNGDGYKDFVINSIYDINDYRVEVYFGGKELDTIPKLIITNNIFYSGFAARAIGDINGDGYDDLIISGPMDDYDAHGRMYIYYGGKDMDNVCDVFLEGKEPFDMFGGPISVVGDVNGDGIADLLVGASQTLGTPIRHGKAYLFYGGKNIGFNNCVEFIGENTTHGYGQYLSGLGDINNDGYKDFGIVSNNFVDIFSGKDLKLLKRFLSAKKFWYPMNIYGNFDLNKDGYNDFIISYAHYENQYSGGFSIYNGCSSIDTIPMLSIDGKTKNSYFGQSLATEDINNDGGNEILVGEAGELTQQNIVGTGTVFIYSLTKIDNVENEIPLPSSFQLNHNYPNPFNPSTTISYTLNKELDITLEIFNPLGQKIRTLLTGVKHAGSYQVKWDAKNNNGEKVPGGVYFLRVTATTLWDDKITKQKIIKMVLAN